MSDLVSWPECVDEVPEGFEVVRDGVDVLGCPIGTDDFVRDGVQAKGESTKKLMDKLVLTFGNDLQQLYKFTILTASRNLTYLARNIPPNFTLPTLHRHDRALREVLEVICGFPLPGAQALSDAQWRQARLTVHAGGMGFFNPDDLAFSACLGSWRSNLSLVLNFPLGGGSGLPKFKFRKNLKLSLMA